MEIREQRLPDEDYFFYKGRLFFQKKAVKEYLKGRILWDSRQGTAVKKKENIPKGLPVCLK